MEEPDNPDRTHTPETEDDEPADETLAPQRHEDDEDDREESLPE
jgi:hypothetical protein